MKDDAPSNIGKVVIADGKILTLHSYCNYSQTFYTGCSMKCKLSQKHELDFTQKFKSIKIKETAFGKVKKGIASGCFYRITDKIDQSKYTKVCPQCFPDPKEI